MNNHVMPCGRKDEAVGNIVAAIMHSSIPLYPYGFLAGWQQGRNLFLTALGKNSKLYGVDRQGFQ